MGNRDIADLARMLLICTIGVVDVGQFQDRIGLEKVAAVLRSLQSDGAVDLEFSGGREVFVSRLDYPLLWQASGYGTVMAVMPLPFSSRLEGMATGLHKAFDDGGIPFSLAYIRGAKKRIEALLEGRCDFILISKMAARLDMEMGVPISLIHEFGRQSYVKEHVAVFRDPSAERIKGGMRVALDPVSIDQTILTSYECQGVEVEFVETPYAQTFQKIKESQLDAVIWTLDEMEERSLGFHVRPLSDKSPRRVAGEDTVAVLATSRERSELGGILQQLVDFAGVQEIQQQVLEKRIQPSY